MSTPADEITIDFDAIDKEVEKGKANGAAASAADTPTVEVAPETTPAAAKQQISTEEGLEKLKQQLEAEKAARETERQGRIAAEQRANDAAQGEVKARTEVQKTQLDTIKGAIEQLTSQNDGLEAQLANAHAAQDYAAVANVQRAIAKNEARLEQLEAGKIALEKAPPPTIRVPTDPVEKLASGLTPKSAAWVRAHPEYATGTHYDDMIEAHNHAMRRGIKAESPEYFAHIEKRLDIAPAVTRADPVVDPDPMADAAQPAARAAPAAAPVSRSAGGNGSKPNTIRLSAEQAEVAKLMFPDSKDPYTEYARNMAALKKEGRLQ